MSKAWKIVITTTLPIVLWTLSRSGLSPHVSEVNSTTAKTKRLHPVCKALRGQSAIQIWSENMQKLLDMPQQQPSFQQAELLELLTTLSPRLPLSTTSTQRDQEPLQRLLRKGLRRYLSLMSNSSSPEEPVRILVVGGSVTQGHSCQEGMRYSRTCAWPQRLERLLNQWILGYYDEHRLVVEVENAAVESTGSYVSLVLLESGVYSGFDILVNSHATNDLWTARVTTTSLNTGDNESHNSTTLEDTIFHTTQHFARTVLDPCLHEQVPLLIWLDDYLGNRKPDDVLFSSSLARPVSTLAHYYGFPFWSYPDAVSDYVHADTQGILTRQWYKGNTYQHDVHPNPIFHQAMAWLVAYNMLSLVTNHCALSTMDMPPAKSLRPLLTKDLTLENVSDRWRLDAASKCHRSIKRCPFSWLGASDFSKGKGREGTFKRGPQGLAPILISTGSWEFDHGSTHKGWVALNASEPMILRLPFNGTLSRLTLFVLQSYGKFADSHVKVAIHGRGERIASQIFRGFHSETTSETKPLVMRFEVQGPLEISIQLVGGIIFKFMGLTICTS